MSNPPNIKTIGFNAKLNESLHQVAAEAAAPAAKAAAPAPPSAEAAAWEA